MRKLWRCRVKLKLDPTTSQQTWVAVESVEIRVVVESVEIRVVVESVEIRVLVEGWK